MSLQEFIPGQRYISQAEPALGLGVVVEVEGRTVQILFPATEQQRHYAIHNAPLHRVEMPVGDQVRDREQKEYTITGHQWQDSLLVYEVLDSDGEEGLLHELELDPFLQLNRPAERLCSGQVDSMRWYELRNRTLVLQQQLQKSDLTGLIGARTSLLPHQLYIAHEISNRYAPRVLLADEVGLGKTIEAGLILHQQLQSGRAKRVLIVVPESLQHQWLLEMLRRFNLRFSLIRASEFAEAEENPFAQSQLCLLSLDQLTDHEIVLQAAMAVEWDLLVVDEAHHLQWSETEVSREYAAIEALAEHIEGVLLLTATPEQLGKSSHFARLRLLDPNRFNDLQAFLDEESDFAPLAAIVHSLLESEPLSAEQAEFLQQLLSAAELADLPIRAGFVAAEEQRDALIQALLDRHGTGRVLMRNTRAAVQGFPPRIVEIDNIDWPVEYQMLEDPLQAELGLDEGEDWTRFDTRLPWLLNRLKQVQKAKVLLITKSADTVLQLAEAVLRESGMTAATFHEDMSLLERDKAAAWFADPLDGARLMICSEIGSEGRNFQFCHHLVMFDLPHNPDLLEQRIGRLDRIGQSSQIQIHVPVFKDSPQAVLARCYHEGLDAFEHTCPVGSGLFEEFADELEQALQQPEADHSDWLARCAARRVELLQKLAEGRDRLLEYNSCRPAIADELVERAEAQDRGLLLHQYLNQLFDLNGIDMDLLRADCYHLTATEHLQSPFPGIPDDGVGVCFDRQVALSNEDLQYLSWTHPIVQHGMERMLTQERGNSVVTTFKHPSFKAGSLLLEAVFVFETASIAGLNTHRFLPTSRIRIVVDQHGRNLTEPLSEGVINQHQNVPKRDIASQAARTSQAAVRELLKTAESQAEKQKDELVQAAETRSHALLDQEIARLQSLQSINRNVRGVEIEHLQGQKQQLDQLFNSTRLRLDNLRLIVML